MKKRWKTLAVAMLGAELTAISFVAALDPAIGFKAILLPAVFPIASAGAVIGGLCAWPIVTCLWPKKSQLPFTITLILISALGTFAGTRIGLSLLAPALAFGVAVFLSKVTVVSLCSQTRQRRFHSLSSDVARRGFVPREDREEREVSEKAD